MGTQYQICFLEEKIHKESLIQIVKFMPSRCFRSFKKNPTPTRKRKLNQKLFTQSLSTEKEYYVNNTSSYAPHQAPVPAQDPQTYSIATLQSSQPEGHLASTQPNILLLFYNPSYKNPNTTSPTASTSWIPSPTPLSN